MNQDAEQIRPQSRSSALAISSLVLGILGLIGLGCGSLIIFLSIGISIIERFTVFFFISVLLTISAVVCGHMARSRIRLFPDRLKGRGVALAGIAVGYLCLVLQLLILLAPAMRGPPQFSIGALCSSNLHQTDIALMAYCYPPLTHYPTNLNQLPSSDVGPMQFVCPGSKNQPGDLTNVMEWMDYIYVAGLDASTPPGVPVLICPSENHEGKGGRILDSDHSTKFYSRPAIDSIISNIMSPTSGYTVVVSKRLTEQSKGKYRSKP